MISGQLTLDQNIPLHQEVITMIDTAVSLITSLFLKIFGHVTTRTEGKQINDNSGHHKSSRQLI